MLHTVFFCTPVPWLHVCLIKGSAHAVQRLDFLLAAEDCLLKKGTDKKCGKQIKTEILADAELLRITLIFFCSVMQQLHRQ